jgi:hypothetical protein
MEAGAGAMNAGVEIVDAAGWAGRRRSEGLRPFPARPERKKGPRKLVVQEIRPANCR